MLMLSFLFLDLVPETDLEAVGLFAAFSLVFGMFFLVVGASKGQPRKSRPKTVVIANQPVEDMKAESSSAALEARSDNPWIDDGDETHSFWARACWRSNLSPRLLPQRKPKGDSSFIRHQ